MRFFQFFIMMIVCCCVLALGGKAQALQVTASTFPMYQLTKQVTQGREGVHVSLLIPAQVGCPHDYMMTPMDMHKLEDADVLVINGLGMEDFLLDALPNTGKAPIVITTSDAVQDSIRFTDHHDAHVEHVEHADHHGAHVHTHTADEVNPHLFVSPRLQAQMVVYLAAELGKIDRDGAALYAKNAHNYAEQMQKLAMEAVNVGKKLRNTHIVTQHGVFDYLARDMGLEVVAVIQAHAGQEPSAAEIIRLVKQIKQADAKAIFIEPQYSRKTGETLSKESNIPLAVLDPAASGPEDAPLDYTLRVMRATLKTLESTLGTH